MAAIGTWLTPSVNGMTYLVLLPDSYNATVKYRVVLYLHQLDMGSGGPSLLLGQINPWFNTTAFRAAYPAIIVAPLLDQTADPSMNTFNFGGMTIADNVGQINALAALNVVRAQYSTDPNRIYITGNSMGGIGAWDMVVKNNAYTGTESRVFAAGLVLAGADYAQGLTPSQTIINALKNVPIWAIHGSQDTTVSLQWDRLLYAAEQAAGGLMRYTEDASLGHDVWDTYYPQTTVWNWLFAQALASTTTGILPTVTESANGTLLSSTTGSITDANGDTWALVATVMGMQVTHNGVLDTTTANVIALGYFNHALFQQTGPNGSWFTWAPASTGVGSGAIGPPGPPGPIGLTGPAGASGTGASNANVLHNSRFTVAQRGAGPFVTNNAVTVDRWWLLATLDTVSVSQVALTDADRAAIGDETARWGLQISFTGNAGATAYSSIRQTIEDARRLAGKSVTTAIWAKATAGTPMLGAQLAQNFGTGGTPSADVNLTGTAIALSATWARYPFTAAVPSLAGQTLGTNGDDVTRLNLFFSCGANHAAQSGGVAVQSGIVTLWDCQMFMGTSALTSENRDPAIEQTDCARFSLVTPVWVGSAAAPTTLTYPTPMRGPSGSAFISGGGAGFTSMLSTTQGLVCYQTTPALQSLSIIAG